MKILEKDLSKIFKIRPSVFIVLSRILFFEIIFEVINFAFVAFMEGLDPVSDGIYLFYAGLRFLNGAVVIIIFLNWYYHYYLITTDDISINTGIFNRRTVTFDFPSIRSINVKQTLLGRVFNYGTVELVIPDLQRKLALRNISDAFDYASVLEAKRIQHAEKEPIEEVMPAV